MKIVAIIQARMSSSRLPGKVLLDLEGKPLIQRVIDNVLCSNVDQIVVATTTNPKDDKLAQWCKGNSISFFRGSENNVLERYFECAKSYAADIVVRVTADDPFKDSNVINKAIDILLRSKYDYVSNTIRPTFPEGLDIEVFTFNALEKCYKNATLYSEKEHVTPYIWKNNKIFSLHNFIHEEDLSSLRWTIDYKEDLNFSKGVYKHLKHKKCLLMEDILIILKRYPKLNDLKKVVSRNEGYIETIREERIDD